MKVKFLRTTLLAVTWNIRPLLFASNVWPCPSIVTLFTPIVIPLNPEDPVDL